MSSIWFQHMQSNQAITSAVELLRRASHLLERGERSTREVGVATDTAVGESVGSSQTCSCSCRQRCRQLAMEMNDVTEIRKWFPWDFLCVLHTRECLIVTRSNCSEENGVVILRSEQPRRGLRFVDEGGCDTG